MVNIVSYLTGSVWKILVKVGDAVEVGQEVAIVEAMKMELPVTANAAGTVKEVLVGEGDLVREGDVLLKMDA